MSDNPKFEVIDRRKYKAEEEENQASQAPTQTPAPTPAPQPEQPAATGELGAGPRLVTPPPSPVAGEPETAEDELPGEPTLPPPPTAEESLEQKTAYDGASERLEDIVRAQNPGAGPQPPVTFENLVQQLYLSAMIQMGAGTQEGQRPRVDILGAKQTIDLLGVLQEKTKGNLTDTEARVLDTVLFEARMAFLELTSMISMPGVPPAAPPPKR